MLRIIVYMVLSTLYSIFQSMDEPAHEITIMINRVFNDSRNSGDQPSRNSAECSRYLCDSRQSADL